MYSLSQSGRRIATRIGGPLIAIVGLTAVTATAAAEQGRKETVRVGLTCVAPAPMTTNYCRLAGLLPGRAADGGDIQWEVVLFHDAEWRIQLQAFSEGPQECQYPIRVWGRIETPGGAVRSFTTREGFVVGISAADQPSLALGVKRLRIDTHGECVSVQ